jgi:MFS family permease
MNKMTFFYGYRIVAALFFCLFVVGGCGFYAFSLFVNPLQAEFGWGRADVMLGYTVFIMLMGGAAPLVGRMINRYDVRKVIAAGAAIGGVGFALLTQTQYIWQFYASYMIIAVGLSAMGIIPAGTIISHWFVKRRGTAIGIATAGIGSGGLALAPLIGGHVIPGFGWETAYLVLAGITLAAIIPTLLVIRSKPSDMGLYPDGAKVAETESSNEASDTGNTGGISLKWALTTPTFWLMAVSFLIFGFISDGVTQHQVPHLEDIGFPVATAATALGGVALGSLSSHPLFGWLCDKIQAKYVLCLAYGLKIVAMIALMNIGPTSSLSLIWLYVICIGVSLGAWITTMSMLTGNNFGLAAYGIIFGAMNLTTSIGSATGPVFSGLMYDTMGNYHTVFWVMLGITIAAIPIALAIRKPKLPVNS